MTPPANTCADCTCACVLQWRCAELRAKCYKCGIYYVGFADLELKRSACAAQSRPVIARPPFCNGALWGLCLEKKKKKHMCRYLHAAAVQSRHPTPTTSGQQRSIHCRSASSTTNKRQQSNRPHPPPTTNKRQRSNRSHLPTTSPANHQHRHPKGVAEPVFT